MPASLWLEEFGSQLWSAFGKPAYLVGSALAGKAWRDVDVRLILDDETWAAMELGDPRCDHQNAKWNALVLAFSALGRQMTGLPIDFQIQQFTWANATFDGPRSAIGRVPLRYAPATHPPAETAPAKLTVETREAHLLAALLRIERGWPEGNVQFIARDARLAYERAGRGVFPDETWQDEPAPAAAAPVAETATPGFGLMAAIKAAMATPTPPGVPTPPAPCGTCQGTERVLSPLDAGGEVITDPCPTCTPPTPGEPR